MTEKYERKMTFKPPRKQQMANVAEKMYRRKVEKCFEECQKSSTNTKRNEYFEIFKRMTKKWKKN